VRRRLLLVLLAFAALAGAAFAAPLLISTASDRTQRFMLNRGEHLDRFAGLAHEALAGGDRAELVAAVAAYHERSGDDLIVVGTDRSVIVQTGMSPADPGVAAAIDAALANRQSAAPRRLGPWTTDDVLFSGPVGTGGQVLGAVVMRSSVRAAVTDIARQWLLILLAALAAAAACVLLALLLAWWVLHPLAALDRGVLAVTAGRGTTKLDERRGPPELRVLTASFNRMCEVVAESASQQRRLVADASHELRTPIARLRLPVDSLAGHVSPEGRDAYRRIVAEIDELESLSNSLLGLANADRAAMELAAGDGVAESCDATELLVERREAWLPTARRAGVTLDEPDAVLPVRLACPETELKQVLDAALDNAIKYAGADTRVRLDCRRASGHGRVAISDDGPGLNPQERAAATTRFWRSRRHHTETGSGLGLAIAERLITTRGGTLVVRANDPHGLIVEVTLPLAEEVAE
jgi:signal transduction histidine kinase